MKLASKSWLVLLVMSMLLSVNNISVAQDGTAKPPIGVISGAHDGYTLYLPEVTNVVFLVDDQGRIVNEWLLEGPAREAHLRPNGNLVISFDPVDFVNPEAGFATSGARIEEYTWDGELVWSYKPDRPLNQVHHGIEPMPNGNILFMTWEYKTRDEAIAVGRNPDDLNDSLWPDAILEYSPTENAIVWEWHAWDHLIQDFDPSAPNYGVISENPQRIDVNFYEFTSRIEDWMHSNAVDYNPELDQVLLSPREFNEVWIIDHSISSEEAKTEAGDLLYRWGNPRAYGRGDVSDRQLSYHHDTQWVNSGYLGGGNIISFSNRHSLDSEIPSGAEDIESEGAYSAIVEFTPPLQEDGTYLLEDGQAFGPTQPAWTFDGLPDHNFYSKLRSGVERLPNGNTFIVKSTNSVMLEVTPDGEVVWEYVPPFIGGDAVVPGTTPSTNVFRARRYASDYEGLQGRDLTPGPRIEERASTQLAYAARIASDETIATTLTSDIPERYFAFNADVHHLVTIKVQADAFTPQINFIQPEGVEMLALVESTDGISYRILAGGRHEFSISSEAGLGDFEFTMVDEGDLFETVDETTPRVLYNTTFTSFITAEDPSSEFAFWGMEGDLITVSMERGGNALEPVITLLDSNLALLTTESDADENGKASIESYTLPYTGVYFAQTSYDETQEVAPIDVDSGSYTFELLLNE